MISFYYKLDTMEINIVKIKQLMTGKSISTTQLAVLMDVKESWVYAVLAGTHGRTFATVEKFGKALAVNPKELIK